MAIKCFQLSDIFSSPIVAACHSTRCFIQKCLPYSPGFEFLEYCVKLKNLDYGFSFYLNNQFSSVYSLIISLIYFATMVKLGGGFLFVTIQLYFVESCCIRYYLRQLLSNLSKNSNSLKAMPLVNLYKQLQLILRYYNQIHQDIFVVVVLNCTGLCIIIASFAIISSWSIITNVQIFVLSVLALEAVFGLMICFGNFAGIYEDSVKFIATLRLPCTIATSYITGTAILNIVRLEYRKITKSLYPLKVRIGSVNYADRFTPITFIDFCLGVVVNMLLIK